MVHRVLIVQKRKYRNIGVIPGIEARSATVLTAAVIGTANNDHIRLVLHSKEGSK
jgi:hypothetical protein